MFMLNATGKKLSRSTDEYIGKLKAQKVFSNVDWSFIHQEKCMPKFDNPVNDPMKAAWLQVRRLLTTCLPRHC